MSSVVGPSNEPGGSRWCRARQPLRRPSRRLDIGSKQDWLRANLILGLETEPWRTTIEETLREHPEGRRIAHKVAASKSPPKARRRK